mgnify:CR=1 FL=1
MNLMNSTDISTRGGDQRGCASGFFRKCKYQDILIARLYKILLILTLSYSYNESESVFNGLHVWLVFLFINSVSN